MGQKHEIPAIEYKSLEETRENEASEAAKKSQARGLFAIGLVEEFDQNELLEPPKRCSIFVFFRVVYSHFLETLHIIFARVLSAIYLLIPWQTVMACA